MIGEVAPVIEMGADATDIGKTIHPRPTWGESIGMAAEVAHGSCNDLSPMKNKQENPLSQNMKRPIRWLGVPICPGCC